MKKYLRVTMPDQSKWDIPAEVIAANRAAFYAQKGSRQTSGEEYDRIFEAEKKNALQDDYDLDDWASNNMDWSEVVATAVLAEPGNSVDYDDGWINGEKRVVWRDESHGR